MLQAIENLINSNGLDYVTEARMGNVALTVSNCFKRATPAPDFHVKANPLFRCGKASQENLSIDSRSAIPKINEDILELKLKKRYNDHENNTKMGDKSMGAFELIEKKEYDAFCALYLEKSHLRSTQSEYADLMPGNYVTALIGTRQYETLVSFCLETIEEIQQNSIKIDRSSSKFFVALSIGYFELKKFPEALQAIRDGSRAVYQDRPRTQVPGILYYEAAMLNDKTAKQESQKMLNACLRNKSALSPEFSAAKFLVGKCSSAEMLTQIDTLPPVLRERAKVQALFYMAVRAFEMGDFDGYAKHLKAACGLYRIVPTVTAEFEYHLAEICCSRIGS